jgi:succinoglycan biosynthesis transport protein ExoP
VDQMRKDLDVDLERDPQRQDISAFTVSYSASDPHLAQRVTGELTELFIAQNNKVQENESEGTTSFLAEQLDEARKQLAAQEAQVDQFQSQHQGALPSQEASNLQILAGLQTQLQNEQDSLNAARQQRAYLQAMFEQEQTSATTVRVNTAGQPSAEGTADLATINQQLEKLRAQLAELSSHYTDEYPDVQSLKNQIAKTEAIRASLIAAAKARSQGGTGVDDSQLSGAALQIKGQLQSNQIEITNRENAISELKARIGEYQGRLNAEPSTDQQLEELTRGYDQSKANYDDLLKKEDQSKMATSMEHLQQGERFTMLDPPSLPGKPDFPNRLKFCGFGLAVGLALGLIVAGGLELMDDRMYSSKEIIGMLPMAVISEIPEVVTESDRQNAKRRLTWGWVATGFVTVVILAGSVFSFLST